MTIKHVEQIFVVDDCDNPRGIDLSRLTGDSSLEASLVQSKSSRLFR